ncbi:MAG TPA: SurA N-terminal domain-containing protein [Silvibacterium sp.]|nr:SurA N-terminal domain-containing protein [Silvibacterium sp.]
MLLVRGGWRRTGTFALSVFLGGLLTSCRQDHVAEAAATVNGRVITRSELDRACAGQSNGTSQTLQISEAGLCKLSALNGLINEEILQQQAEKLHIAATEDDIESRLIEMKAPYTEEEFADYLKHQGVTINELKREIGRSQSQENLLNKEINLRITVTDADIASYYQAHASEFNLPEQYFHLAKIVVNTDSDPANALKKIATILDLLHSGQDFSVVAEKYSDDKETSPKGGDMGMVPESALKGYPAVYEAISKRQSGQFTDVIPIRENSTSTNVTRYVIVKIIETVSAGQHKLADPRVQQRIRSELHQRRSELLTTAYLEILRSKAHVRNYLAEDFFKNG